MKESNLIDDLGETKELVLFSRLSILLMSLLTTPLFGGLLYCINLLRIGKKDKIFGTYIAIALTNFFVLIPFFGFELKIIAYIPIFHLNNIIVGFLMISPFWKMHFSSVKYSVIFPWGRFIIMIVFFVGYNVYDIWLNTHFSYFNPRPLYLPKFNFLTIFILISVVIFAKFIYDSFAMIYNRYLRNY